MEVKIQFPESVGEKILRLPDRDAFVTSAVAQALHSRSRQTLQASPKARPLPPLSNREREDAWRRSNQELLQGRFAGQWVVLEGETIVAHGENAAQAVEEARAKGVEVPFVFYVAPRRRPGVARIGL